MTGRPDVTSYVVEASYTILDRDGDQWNRRDSLLVGRFREKDAATKHADVEVEVLNCFHLRSGSAVAQLVHDIYGGLGRRDV